MAAVGQVGRRVAVDELPQFTPQDPLLAQLIARYGADRQAAVNLIGSLQGRIRVLERNLGQERLNRSEDAERYEEEINELSEALEALQEQLQEQSQEMDGHLRSIRDLEQQNGDNSATIGALRREVTALTAQVTQGRDLVNQLNGQFQAVADRNRALTVQLQQVVISQPKNNDEDCSFSGKLQASLLNMFGMFGKR